MRIALATILLALSPAVLAHHSHAHRNTDAQPGQFDYYLLSLSWAPTYCLTHADAGPECAGKGYGFVLHGLWPQYDDGGYPQSCSTQFELSADAAAKGRTIYPSERLMQHEWRVHGTCSGLDSMEYFRAADRSTAVVRIPVTLETPQSEQNLSAAQISALFLSANPEMPAGALSVACSRGSLSEVRVCLTKELMLRRCGRGVHTTCPHTTIAIPASR